MEKLELDTSHLPRIPEESVKGYKENSESLVEVVNESFANREDIGDLIGDNSIEKMFENHENHVRFMTNVFILNDYDLLTRTVIWVYRTYRAHGFSDDYFLVELEAWKGAVDDQLKSESASPINKIYSFLLENHEAFIKSSEKIEETGLDVSEEWQGTYEEFLESLLKGDHRKAIEQAEEAVNSGEDVGEFFENVLRPAMYFIGSRWQNGELAVAEEHLASSIVSRVLSALYSRILTLERTRGRAVVTATANEVHEIGSRIIADSLEMDGWDVNHLGVDTPIPDLIDMLKKQKPFLLGLSLTIPFNLENVVETIEEIRNHPELDDMKILVGGKAFNDNPELWERTGADAWCENSTEAKEVAREWWRERN
ncbi:cobalamin-dependent protein [Candidatus Bipolaricaulota bacterium]|nr:cobalamin-dependent protein [Candidatus Bipolaricaulota bacterium]